MLIFDDGFSTRAEVTALSGRGVGLSVVRQELERLGGTVRVDSVCGMGSRFDFTLPYRPLLSSTSQAASEQKADLQKILGLLAPLPRVMQALCEDHLKMTVTQNGHNREWTVQDLYEFTALLPLGGGINARLGLSIELPLLLEMTRRFDAGIPVDEAAALAESVGAEITTMLIGRATVYYTHLARRVVMGAPQVIAREQQLAHFGKRVLRGFKGFAEHGQFIVLCLLDMDGPA